jgi:hypothetical protein
VQSQLPVIRTYSGPDRQAVESAYRADVGTARLAGWVPVAHRWRTEGDQQVLAVVFELPEIEPASRPDTGSPVEPTAERTAVEPTAAEPTPAEPAPTLAAGDLAVGEAAEVARA